MRSLKKLALIIGVVLFGVFLLKWWQDTKAFRASPGQGSIPAAALAKARDARPLADCTQQADRQRLIQDMKRRGLVTKYDQPATLPHLWVGWQFKALSYDQKQLFAGVFLAEAWCRGGHNLLRLRDDRTGKDVGRISVQWGFEWF